MLLLALCFLNEVSTLPLAYIRENARWPLKQRGQNSVLYETLLLLALCVDRRGGRVGLLAATHIQPGVGAANGCNERRNCKL